MTSYIQEENHSGFLNEAKDWAGELLSGQTKVVVVVEVVEVVVVGSSSRGSRSSSSR